MTGPDKPPVRAEATFRCPCCGWPGLSERPFSQWPDRPPPEAAPPYSPAFGLASFEICACCGFQFGYDDDPGASGTATSFEHYRARWRDGRCEWFSPATRPAGFDVDAQLARAGLDTAVRSLSDAPVLTRSEFVANLVAAVPEAEPILIEHVTDHDEVLLHVLTAALRRLALQAHQNWQADLFRRLLDVLDEGLDRGNDYVHNAIAVSFVEDSAPYDPANDDYIANWPENLATEARRQRTEGTQA